MDKQIKYLIGQYKLKIRLLNKHEDEEERILLRVVYQGIIVDLMWLLDDYE